MHAIVVILLLCSVSHAEDSPEYLTPAPSLPAPQGPEEIDADTVLRMPLGYTAVERQRKGMLIGGGITFAAGYFYSALTAAFLEYRRGGRTYKYDALWIPVAGPFIQIPRGNPGDVVIEVGLGSAQIIGVIMLYYGLTTTNRVYVRTDLVDDLALAPIVGGDASGLAVSGRF